MKCPVCNVDLTMTDRQGVEIDYCPNCRGVWLDRGELDKIIERAAPASTEPPRREAPRMEAPRAQPPGGYEPRYDRDDDDKYRGDYRYGRKKKKGFLGELFDFD